MKVEAIKVRRLYLEVANQIESLISDGKVKPGERLPSERELATQFEVSRPSIREAMIALEIAGLVEIRTGSGIYVLPNIKAGHSMAIDDDPGPFEILEARLIIEGEAASLAAARITDEQLLELETAIKIMDDPETSEVDKEKADQLFHCTIADATNNSALHATVKWLWELRNRSPISATFHQKVRDLGIHPYVDEHMRIYKALKMRDPKRALLAMQSHISKAIEDDMEVLEVE